MNMNSKKTAREKIPISTQLKLWVVAGGRCEFNGCNEYLFKDNLTLSETNFADIAHIVAYRFKGARGNDSLPTVRRNLVGNLMLACKKHHKLIDDKKYENKYPKELLKSYKDAHEKRIYRLTNIKLGNKTHVICLTSKIANSKPTIPTASIDSAISPRYRTENDLHINLCSYTDKDSNSYWQLGKQQIKEEITKFLAPNVSNYTPDHLSIFAFARIPFLIYLGKNLPDKIETIIYQKHRHSQSWTWGKRGKIIKYSCKLRKKGRSKSKVALILSISGVVNLVDLPTSIRNSHYIYEITPINKKSSSMILNRLEDILTFKETYHSFLRHFHSHHMGAQNLKLFPAIPLSIAVCCGSELLPRVDPALDIYDYNKEKMSFVKCLTVR